jgi:hypothetical protein
MSTPASKIEERLSPLKSVETTWGESNRLITWKTEMF